MSTTPETPNPVGAAAEEVTPHTRGSNSRQSILFTIAALVTACSWVAIFFLPDSLKSWMPQWIQIVYVVIPSTWTAILTFLAIRATLPAPPSTTLADTSNPTETPMSGALGVPITMDTVATLAVAANNCELLAGYHNRKSRSYMAAGITIGAIGLFLYIAFLFASTSGEHKSIDAELDTIKDEFSRTTVDLGELKSKIHLSTTTEETENQNQLAEELAQTRKTLADATRDLSDAQKRSSFAYDSSVQDALHAQERLARTLDNVSKYKEVHGHVDSGTLRTLESSLSDEIEKLRATSAELGIKAHEVKTLETAISFRRDVLPIIRSTFAFLFIEVMAGFFLSLAQRNDIQAIYWRSHRQVYERLMAAPALIRSYKSALGTDVLDVALVQTLLTPIDLPIAHGGKNSNPPLAALTALGDFAQRSTMAIKAEAATPGKKE